MGLFSRRSSQPENSQPETQELMVIAMITLPEAGWPARLRDLTDSAWKGRAGIAKPLFGTTATHAAFNALRIALLLLRSMRSPIALMAQRCGKLVAPAGITRISA